MTAAPRLVDPQIERDLARLLGATSPQADVLIDLLEHAGLLAHGVVVIGEVAAARWGIELPDAVVAMAEGRALPEGISDYELRTAAEEGADDLEALWEGSERTSEDDHAVWRRILQGRSSDTQSDNQADNRGMVVASPFNIDVAALLDG